MFLSSIILEPILSREPFNKIKSVTCRHKAKEWYNSRSNAIDISIIALKGLSSNMLNKELKSLFLYINMSF